ncbi:MAG: glycosyltransferase [Acidobacteriota bacterium]|nr:glycosyltransferase [Acidobacteriota bacterium]
MTAVTVPDLSLVLPVFNAALFVERSLAEAAEFLGRGSLSWEIIAVDDGSTDDTAARLAARSGENVRIVSLPRNLGKFGALRAGMQAGRGRCRVFTDADLPFDLDAVLYMARLVNDRGFHVVTGDRTLMGSDYRPHVSRRRDTASAAFSFLVRMLVTGGLFDTQCGLKAFRSDVAEALFPLLAENGFAGDVELLYVALKYNLEIKRVPVRLRRSEPTTVHLGLDSLRMLGRIASLRQAWDAGRYRSPALERIGRQTYWTPEAERPAP